MVVGILLLQVVRLQVHLTANGTNRISWNSGTPKTAASTSLTLTITGTLTEMLVEDVTGQANQNPSENIVIGAEHGTNAGNVKYFNYQNNNTVDGSGVVTEAQGAAISAATMEGVAVEEVRTNTFTSSEDISDAAYLKTELQAVTASPIDAPPQGSKYYNIIPTTSNLRHYFLQNSASVVGTRYTTSLFVKANGYDFMQITGSSFGASGGGFGNGWVNFNIANGTIAGSSLDAGDEARITPFKDGYRISLSKISIITSPTLARMIICVINANTLVDFHVCW